jgi:hypothetical protein
MKQVGKNFSQFKLPLDTEVLIFKSPIGIEVTETALSNVPLNSQVGFKDVPCILLAKDSKQGTLCIFTNNPDDFIEL